MRFPEAVSVLAVLPVIITLSGSALGVRAGHPLRKRHLGVSNECGRLHVEILVSPVVARGEVRAIELQWEYAPARPGDWLALFTSDPLNSSYLPPTLYTTPVTQTHGWVKTPVLEQHLEPEQLGFKARCLGYYALYLDANNVSHAATCLRLEPTWMWHTRADIGDRPLRTLFIPGTHDSAAYGEHDEEMGDSRVKKYSITQDESVLSQLVYGVRYIDLRVGYYPSNREEWWGNHGIARLHPLRVILRDVRTFLDNTQEIVLLDLQEFPVGFGKEKNVHRKLVSFLSSELGLYAASPTLGYHSTLNEIWRSGKRLIIGYDDRAMVVESLFLWPPVQHKWGNVQSLPALYNYLSGVLERPPSTAWSAMAQLTPTTLDVLLDTFKGLRRAAEQVNHNVTAWFRSQAWARRTNVVSVDFVRGSGIIRAAIEFNKFQGSCH